MMLTLSQLALSAETANSKAANYYSCMFARKDNYYWGITITKSVPQSIKNTMTTDEIVTLQGPEQIASEVIWDATQKTFLRFAKSAISKSNTPDYNLVQDFAHHVQLFNRYSRLRLRDAFKSSVLSEPITYEILFTPKMARHKTDELYSEYEVPVLSVYPDDRLVLAGPIVNTYTRGYEASKVEQAKKGISELTKVAVGCGNETGGYQAFPLSMMVKLTINPDIESSKLDAQFVVGMPMDLDIPFSQENDQIKFTAIRFPEKTKIDVNTSKDIDMAEFPTAIINLESKFNETLVPIQIRFGGLGGFDKTGWTRSKSASNDQFIKLMGDPKGGVVQENLKVRMHIYNLDLSFDYAKMVQNQAAELSQSIKIDDIKLLISAGLKTFPGISIGQFAVKNVDEQFRSEGNKTIIAQLDDAPNKAVAALNDFKNGVVSTAAAKTGLKPDQLNSVLNAIFSQGQSVLAETKK